MVGLLFLFVLIESAFALPDVWNAGPVLLAPGPAGSFDETAVKDPSVVQFQKRWHVFYTARGQGRYALGYVSALRLEELATAPRTALRSLGGHKEGYAAAPQVFYFAPQERWYLVYQTRDQQQGADYLPVYASTRTLDQPESWEGPHPLADKADTGKWIDFWVICDETTAYLFYTRNHREVCAMTTPLADFPHGFAAPKVVFEPVHEAVHLYKAAGKPEYHMLYEMRTDEDIRHFELATAPHPLGPWRIASETYAAGAQLRFAPGEEKWSEEVSHGEFLRTGYDQRLEYDSGHPRLLIQGLLVNSHRGAYSDLSWKLGLIQSR